MSLDHLSLSAALFAAIDDRDVGAVFLAHGVGQCRPFCSLARDPSISSSPTNAAFSIDAATSFHAVNTSSFVFLAHCLIPALAARPAGGCFVLLSSCMAQCPFPFISHYAAAKAFLSSFAMSIASETPLFRRSRAAPSLTAGSRRCSGHGLDISVVHPGPVKHTQFYSTRHMLPPVDRRTTRSAASNRNWPLQVASKFGTTPALVARACLASPGRSISVHVGFCGCLCAFGIAILGPDGAASFWKFCMGVFDYFFFA
jgi:NAD(P)-dependent dehydrogenase (short-subunit alcohol dehydrogenase family)